MKLAVIQGNSAGQWPEKGSAEILNTSCAVPDAYLRGMCAVAMARFVTRRVLCRIRGQLPWLL